MLSAPDLTPPLCRAPSHPLQGYWQDVQACVQCQPGDEAEHPDCAPPEGAPTPDLPPPSEA